MKANSFESARRTQEVGRLLTAGKSTSEIVEICRKKWRIAPAQIHAYIRKNHELWKEEAQRRREELVAEHFAFRKRIYEAAFEKEDYQTALRAVQDLAKLQGLYPEAHPAQPQMIQQSFHFSSDEKGKMISLLRKIAKEREEKLELGERGF